MTADRGSLKKQQWIDVLKGIGIITVVACHLFEGPVIWVLLLLNMPVFFFLSGYLARRREDAGNFFREKLIHLLVPYVAFVTLIYSPYILFKLLVRHIGVMPTLSMVGDVLIGGRLLTGFGAPFWFVPCLFMTQQFMNALVKHCSDRIVLATMIACYTLGMAHSLLLPEFWLPLNANVVLASAPLFYLGMLVRSGRLGLSSALAWAGALAGIFLAAYGVNNKYDMKWANYGLPIVTLASSFCVVMVLIGLSRRLCEVPVAGGLLALLGEASIIIMFMHQSIQLALLGLGWPAVARFFACIALSVLAYLVINKSAYARAVLLGSKPDFLALFGRRKAAADVQ